MNISMVNISTFCTFSTLQNEVEKESLVCICILCLWHPSAELMHLNLKHPNRADESCLSSLCKVTSFSCLPREWCDKSCLTLPHPQDYDKCFIPF